MNMHRLCTGLVPIAAGLLVLTLGFVASAGTGEQEVVMLLTNAEAVQT